MKNFHSCLSYKAILGNTSVLLAQDFNKSFKLAVDASDIGVATVLLLEDDNRIDHPVCYFSKKLDKHNAIIQPLRKNVWR